jgi:two-component system, NtrC family, sensor kinase
MRSFLSGLLFFVVINYSQAQDSAVTIVPAMFTATNEILIGTMDGWRFRKTNDSTWIKLKPTELSAKLADRNGRMQGWLTFTFRLNKDFVDIPLYLRYKGWAAADLYIDGKLVQSFGQTGTGGRPYREYNSSNKLPNQVNLKTETTCTISLYIVDYTSPFSAKHLKSESDNLWEFIRLVGPRYYKRYDSHIREWPVYTTIWLCVCSILTLLFWLLAFMNRREKNLSLFAFCATSFLVGFWAKIISESNSISFREYQIYYAVYNFFGAVSSCLTIVIVAKVFKNRVPLFLKIIIASLFAIGMVVAFTRYSQLQVFSTLVPVIIYISYILASRKTLKGAQWAIVIGLLLYCSLVFLYIFLVSKYKTDFIPYNMPVVTGLILSFPLSLLVYIALRFREIVNEVRQNAAQVLQLSEEKRERALKQKELLEEEVAKQTIELRTSLENLKATQAQLIQSEKMASLGELTAGIAHEIQNPLNFVNNFSEVNKELIEELHAERLKPKADRNEQLENEILNDLKGNEEKINHHGKRADAIVKGMLQHSRTSSGQKELTDINALADEYLRLAYHGLRAKDKSFNATMKTDFDESIGNINIIPQDIGRVILNLITNAFYVVDEKKKQVGEARPDDPVGRGYEPTVSVSTTKINGKVEVKIKDNGNGIPQKVLDKIFQPFFTTKPTGQGTGLGLSLSYDIVKAHGGELRVETKEGEGSTFIFQLPGKSF